MSVFEKKCSNCIFCLIHDYGYCKEMYCDASECKHNDGMDILDEKLTSFKCNWYKNKHIYTIDGKTYEIVDDNYLGVFNKNSEIICSSNNIKALNDFLEKPSNLYMMNTQLNEKNKNLKDFIDFFKSELPEVYKKMWKEYKKFKRGVTEENDIK